MMKTVILVGAITAAILIAGCGKKPSPSNASGTPSAPPADAASPSPSAFQPALAAWKQGDKPAAISNFVATDWNTRPLFPSSSPLNLTEEQFDTLSEADRQTEAGLILAQLVPLKELAAGLAQAGRDAAAKGDTAQARKYFTALKQSGAALDSPDNMKLVQMVGQAFEKMSDKGLAQLNQ